MLLLAVAGSSGLHAHVAALDGLARTAWLRAAPPTATLHVSRPQQRLLPARLQTLLELVPEDARSVADIACDHCKLTIGLANRGHRVVGIDVSEHSMHLARTNVAADSSDAATRSRSVTTGRWLGRPRSREARRPTIPRKPSWMARAACSGSGVRSGGATFFHSPVCSSVRTLTM